MRAAPTSRSQSLVWLGLAGLVLLFAVGLLTWPRGAAPGSAPDDAGRGADSLRATSTPASSAPVAREAVGEGPAVPDDRRDTGEVAVTVEGLEQLGSDGAARLVLERQAGPGVFDEVAVVERVAAEHTFVAVPYGVYRVAVRRGVHKLVAKPVVHRAPRSEVALVLTRPRGYRLELVFTGAVGVPEIRTWPATTVLESGADRALLAVADDEPVQIEVIDREHHVGGWGCFNPGSAQRKLGGDRFGPLRIALAAFASCAFETGRVPAAASIELRVAGRDDVLAASAIENARAEFVDLTAGSYRIVATDQHGEAIATVIAGEDPRQEMLRLTAGKRHEVVLLPRPSLRVAGHVRAGGAAIAGATVLAFEARPDPAFAGVVAPVSLQKPLASASTGAGGSFAVDVPQWTSQLLLVARRDESTSAIVSVRAPCDDVELEVSPLCTVAGTATCAHVEFCPVASPGSAVVFAVNDRSFATGPLPQGRYRVSLLAHGGQVLATQWHELDRAQRFLELEGPTENWECTFASAAEGPRRVAWTVGIDRGTFDVPAGATRIAFAVHTGAGTGVHLACTSERLRSTYAGNATDGAGGQRIVSVPANDASFVVRLPAGQRELAVVLAAKANDARAGALRHVDTTIDALDGVVYAIPAGTYDVVARGGAEFARGIVIEAARTFELDLANHPECDVVVRVTRPDGAPLAGVAVHAIVGGADASAPTKTGADGQATLRVRRDEAMFVRLYRRQDDLKLMQRVWSDKELQSGVPVAWSDAMQTGSASLVVEPR